MWPMYAAKLSDAAAAAHGVEVLRERLELVPWDAGGEARRIHVLDLLHRAADEVAVSGRVGEMLKPQFPATTVVTP